MKSRAAWDTTTGNWYVGRRGINQSINQSINHWFIKTVDKPQPFTVDNKISSIKRNTMNA